MRPINLITGNRLFEERDFAGVGKLSDEELEKEFDKFGEIDGAVYEEPEKQPEKTPEPKEEIEDPEKVKDEPPVEGKAPDGDGDTPPEKDTEKPEAQDTDDPKKDTASNILDQTLTDDMISKLNPNNFTDEDKTYLKKYLGQSLEIALKSLAHSQKTIGQRNTQFFSKQKEQPKPPEQSESRADVNQLISKFVDKDLREEFPDMPIDIEERKQWEKDMNYEDGRKYHRYLELEKESKKKSTDYVHYAVEVQSKYPEWNEQTLRDEVKAIESYAKELGIPDLKRLGYDLTLQKDTDGSLFNPLLDPIITDEKADVIKMEVGVPLIKKERVMTEFFRRHLTEIIKKNQINARVTNQNKEPEKLPKGVLTSTARTKKEFSEQSIKNMGFDDIDKALDQLEKG